MASDLLRFWAKARRNSCMGAEAHPLVFHSLDVAAVAECLIDLFPNVLRPFTALECDERSARLLLVRLCALHDIGKFARGFQMKAHDYYARVFGPVPDASPRGDHVAIGYWLLSDCLRAELRGLGAFGPDVRKKICMAVAAHHGRPVTAGANHSEDDIGHPNVEAARTWISQVLRILPGDPCDVDAPPDVAGPLSLALAGLVNLADWIGSNASVFAYEETGDIEDYWLKIARPRARAALAMAGIAPCRSSHASTFSALTGRPDAPSPLQEWAEAAALPESGPVLALIEDMTGAGKTEAALILAHRLIRSGRASGLYTALPTMATANAMYARLERIYRRLFGEGETPSLALAHGAAHLHEGFSHSILRVGAPDPDYSGAPDDATASAACAAWIADDRRKAFFADVGAGTIDQAFLAVLPTKFAALRLIGLSRRVLLIDEAHAYASYEGEELARLIEFHAAQGGCAIVLSATLPERTKHDLLNAFRRGLNDPVAKAVATGWKAEYPLATLACAGEVIQTPVATRADRQFNMPVRRLSSEDETADRLTQVAAAGGCAAWVRNSVDDAIEAYDMLRRRGLDPIQFHARFAMCDRQAIEARVLETFGRDSKEEMRAGRLLVATQVVEQSLDLDFDFMASDLAPIDLLIQRAGRVWRHRPRKRPMADAEFAVLSPDPNAQVGRDWFSGFLRRASFVYPNHALLWRSADVLLSAGQIEAPGGVRALIEAVYGATGLDHAPEALRRRREQADGVDRAERSQALNALLTLRDGYDARREWEGDLLIPTRLGGARTVLRLAQWDGASLAPWSTPRSGSPDDIARAWALSEVAVAAHRVREIAYDGEIGRAVKEMQDNWRIGPNGPFIAVLTKDGEGRLGFTALNKSRTERKVLYDPVRGVVFSDNP